MEPCTAAVNNKQTISVSAETIGSQQNNVVADIIIDENSQDAGSVDSTVVNTDLNEFVGVERSWIKRVYLGGVKEGTNPNTIKKFMEEKGIRPTFVRMMKSKRKGTVAVRVNVKAADLFEILKQNVWPKKVYARQWLSKTNWGKKQVSSETDT